MAITESILTYMQYNYYEMRYIIGKKYIDCFWGLQKKEKAVQKLLLSGFALWTRRESNPQPSDP